MKKLLLAALMPLLLIGASLTPVGPQLKDGAGGFLWDGKLYSRSALPMDDGSVLFVGRNPGAKYADYIAVLKSSGSNAEVARSGYVASYIGLQANDNWNVFGIGRNGLYGTISYFNGMAFLYVSDGSAGVFALMIEGMPLDGVLQDEGELAVSRIASSGNGKVVLAQIASHDMTVFKRGEDGKWVSSKRETDDFTSELFRGIALNYDGTWMWHFTQHDQSCWLTLTETIDGMENETTVVQVDDGTQHSYYVACSDEGNVVYFTKYINGKAMLMKGVYEDGVMKEQVVTWGVSGGIADGDSRQPACSADGRFAVFSSRATNLTADAVDGTFWQIYVYDSLRNEVKLMSTLGNVAANDDCETPMISAGGHYVTFTSMAASLDVIKSSVPRLYRAKVENVDMTQGVVASGTALERIDVDDAGDRVVFSTAAALAVGDDNILKNIYGRDLTAGVTYAVSPLDTQDYQQCAISGDGRQVVYIPYNKDNADWPGLGDYDDVCSLSLDFDGDVLAYIDKTGRLMLQKRGELPIVLATDATDTTGASSTVRLSHDGQVLVYTFKTASNTTGLKAWFAETKRFVTLTEDSPQYVYLSQSGRYAFYRKKDYKLYRRETTGGVEKAVVDAGYIFVVSCDGRYAYHDSRSSDLLVRQELFGNQSVMEIGDSGGTRYSTIATSADGGRVFYVQDSALVYDTLSVADEGTVTVTGTCATDVMENTDGETAYEIALQASGNADYALRLVDDTSADGGVVSLLYPNGTRPWYALNYIPKKFFCGEDTVAVELWNGHEWIAANVAITVENVNNLPEWTEDTVVLEAKENEISGNLSLDDLLIDHDLDYVEVTAEEIELSVKGPDASKLLRLDGGVLHADLTGRFDLVARGDGMFEYSVTAMDKAGEKCVMTLQLKIANTDRAPTLDKVEATAYEGLPIEWSWFAVDDPDTEDTDDNLRLCFQSRHAEFYGNDGEKLNAADGVFKSQFPIIYRSTCNIQQDAVDVCAKDLDGLTSKFMTLSVEAAYIEVSLAELYGGYDGEGNWGWSGVSDGWNLLSVPCDIPEDGMAAYKAMMGLEVIWRWTGRRFEEATSLRSDEGFWGYIAVLPDEPQGTLTGYRSFTALRKGWNLRGAYGASQGGVLWMLEKNRRHPMLVQQSEAVEGFGHWVFVK